MWSWNHSYIANKNRCPAQQNKSFCSSPEYKNVHIERARQRDRESQNIAQKYIAYLREMITIETISRCRPLYYFQLYYYFLCHVLGIFQVRKTVNPLHLWFWIINCWLWSFRPNEQTKYDISINILLYKSDSKSNISKRRFAQQFT